MLKEQEIIDAIQNLGLVPAEHGSIVAAIMPGASTYMLGAIFTAMSIKNYALHFNEENIIIFDLTFNANMAKAAHVIIPKEHIRFLSFHEKMAFYQLSINVNGQNLEYRVSKKILKAKWHKENLAYILNQYKIKK